MVQKEKIYLVTEERDEKGMIPTLTREEYIISPSMIQNLCVCSVKFSNDGRTATITKPNGQKFDAVKDAEQLDKARKYFQNLVNKNRETESRDTLFRNAERTADAIVKRINADSTIMTHVKALFGLNETKRNKKGETTVVNPVISMKLVAIAGDDGQVQIAGSFDKDKKYKNANNHKVGRIFQTKREEQVTNIYAPVQSEIAKLLNPDSE